MCRYILGFENLLRVVDCRITIRFWNWALYNDIVWSSTPTYHIWKSIGGFGGNGKMEDGYCVTNGTFKFDKWKILNYQNVNNIISEVCNYSKGCVHQSFLNPFYNTCLRRRFQCATPTYKHVYLTINNLTLRKFYLFNIRVKDYWHNNIHNCVGRFHCLFVRECIYI